MSRERQASQLVTAKDLLDAIYDPVEDKERDSVSFGFILGQYERLTGDRP